MPPKVHLADYLSPEELRLRYRQASDRVEARRWQLLHLIAQQWTIKQAAVVVGLSYDYSKEIVKRYNREGPSSVRNRSKDRKPPPSRSLLDENQQAELREALKEPPADGGTWTGPKVAQWIAKKTNRSQVWPQRGWEYLKRLSIRSNSPEQSDSSTS